MPPAGHISKTRKLWLHIYSLAIEQADPLATQEEIRAIVDSQKKMLRKLGLKPLSESRANDYIREIQHANERRWLDSPWHLGIFAANCAHELEFPPDQLPVVMAVGARVFAGGKRLTARQAIWVARLNGLHKLNPDNATDSQIQNLYLLAIWYSARETTATLIADTLHTEHLPLPPEHESDTWDLDFSLAVYDSEVASFPLSSGSWDAYKGAQAAGIAPAIKVPKTDWSESGIADTDAVAKLHTLIRNAVPTAVANWRTLTALLIAVRTKALEPEWEEWSEQQRQRFIREIAGVETDDQIDDPQTQLQTEGE
jgi:hypothetical protein